MLDDDALTCTHSHLVEMSTYMLNISNEDLTFSSPCCVGGLVLSTGRTVIERSTCASLGKDSVLRCWSLVDTSSSGFTIGPPSSVTCLFAFCVFVNGVQFVFAVFSHCHKIAEVMC